MSDDSGSSNPLRVPRIDNRNYKDIFEELRKYSPFYVPEWDSNNENDIGVALSKIFSHIMIYVTDRLNKIPQRNYIEFLNILGVKLSPTRPANANVIFFPTEGIKHDVLVRSGSRIVTPANDKHDEIAFETSENLLVTNAKLVDVWSTSGRKSNKDGIYLHTQDHIGNLPFNLFVGNNLQKHILYMRDQSIFNIKKDSEIIIQFKSNNAEALSTILKKAEWEYNWKLESDNAKQEEIVSKFYAETSHKENICTVHLSIIKFGRVKFDKYVLKVGEILNLEVETRDPSVQPLVIVKSSTDPHGKIIDLNRIPNSVIFHGNTRLVSKETLSSHKYHKKILFVYEGDIVTATYVDNNFESSSAGIVNSSGTPKVEENKVDNITGYWIRCSLCPENFVQLKDTIKSLTIDEIKIWNQAVSSSFRPDMLFYNNVPLLTEPIFPFGEKPILLDTFYIACESGLSKKNTVITLSFKCLNNLSLLLKSNKPILTWEYWNGITWASLKIDDQVPDPDNNLSQWIKFLCPTDIYPTEVNGIQNFWIRSRIISGDYGKEKLVPVGTSGTRLVRLTNPGVTAGNIDLVSITTLPNNRVITAVKDGSGNLMLIAWRVNPSNGTITRLTNPGVTAGNIDLVSITTLPNNRVITAVKDGSGNLMLIAWRVNPSNGTITRLTNPGVTAGNIDLVSITTLPNNRVITAVKDGSGNLMLIAWRVNPSNGTITRLTNPGVTAGNIDLVSITTLPNNRVITAVKDGSGNLMLIAWRVNPSNGTITRLTNPGVTAGNIDLVSITTLPNNRVITAVKDGSGNLMLIAWRVNPSNGTITRLTNPGVTAGNIDLVSITTLPNNRVITAVKDGSGNLMLIAWRVNPSNGTITRLTNPGVTAGNIDLVSITTLPNNRVITAVKDGSGNLMLIAWGFLIDDVPPEYQVDLSEILFPKIFNIDLSFAPNPKQPENCISYNNLEYTDHIVKVDGTVKPFVPFYGLPDDVPAIYFGLDRQPKQGPINLYFSITPFDRHDDNNNNNNNNVSTNNNNKAPSIHYYYYSEKGRRWKDLDIIDGTRDYVKSGYLKILFPPDFSQYSLFGKKMYWIKAMDTRYIFASAIKYAKKCPGKDIGNDTDNLKEKINRILPHIKGIYLNTVPSVNLAKINEEIIGSSNGEQNQYFKFSRMPVVFSNKFQTEIWINEARYISEEDLEKLKKNEEIREVRDLEGVVHEVWVRWHEVQDIVLASSEDRYYESDNAVGLIKFGDGVRGKIPPIGRDNIKVTYHIGGGTTGNVTQGEINFLKSPLPFIESVMNAEAANGGMEVEKIESALLRGPQFIKHRGQAVTTEDFEWLIREKFPSIARVKCLSNSWTKAEFRPGHVVVVVVPQSSEEKPVPSVELMDIIEQYLQTCSSNIIISSNNLRVISPIFIKISVTADIYPKSIEFVSEIEKETKESLKKFLHPLHGGINGNGWDLGTLLCFSDIYSLFHKIDRIDHIDNLFIDIELEENSIAGDLSDCKRICKLKFDDIADPTKNILPILKHSLIFNGEHNLVFKFLKSYEEDKL